MKRRIILPLVAILAVVSGCSEVHQDAPEPSPSDIINGARTQVIQMPEGFRNVAFTCYGTVGIYVTSRGWIKGSADKNLTPLPSDIAVVPNDPHCAVA